MTEACGMKTKHLENLKNIFDSEDEERQQIESMVEDASDTESSPIKIETIKKPGRGRGRGRRARGTTKRNNPGSPDIEFDSEISQVSANSNNKRKKYH